MKKPAEEYKQPAAKPAVKDAPPTSLGAKWLDPNDVVIRLVRNAKAAGATDEELYAIEEAVHAAAEERAEQALTTGQYDRQDFLHKAETLLVGRPELLEELRQTLTQTIEIPPPA